MAPTDFCPVFACCSDALYNKLLEGSICVCWVSVSLILHRTVVFMVPVIVFISVC